MICCYSRRKINKCNFCNKEIFNRNIRLTCGHNYHYNCYQKILKNVDLCVKCKDNKNIVYM